ncbi:hypothetical protein BH09PAT2_BH09PAT2_06200 [soil metagenome]
MIRKHTIAIGHALDGISWAIKTQPNYRVHFLASFLTILGGIFFSFSTMEWLVAIVMMTGGFAIETLNTAVEQLGDAIDKNYNPTIKIAKDLSAGAMLIYSIGAVIVACILFLPKIINVITS